MEDAAATVGSNLQAIYRYLVAARRTDLSYEEYSAFFEKTCIEMYGRVSLVPGARELLRECRRLGLKTALASSSSRSWIDIVLRRFKLEGEFDVVLSGMEFRERGKPAPDIFLRTAKLLRVEPAECLVVEDSHLDGLVRAGDAVVVGAGAHSITLVFRSSSSRS
jgi:HAD superfamily hydrolase (TIGR01509 family)